jgi:hypothetical protein
VGRGLRLASYCVASAAAGPGEHAVARLSDVLVSARTRKAVVVLRLVEVRDGEGLQTEDTAPLQVLAARRQGVTRNAVLSRAGIRDVAGKELRGHTVPSKARTAAAAAAVARLLALEDLAVPAAVRREVAAP